jgi:DNA-directed RNA polymerase specialized sigma24 family protein
MEAGPGQISRALVRRAQAGDRGATDELFTSLYNELHRLARREVHRSGPHGLLSTTTLLHETYLDISRRDALAFADAGQFLAYAARAVRKSAAAAWTSPARHRDRRVVRRARGLEGIGEALACGVCTQCVH